MCHNLPQKHMFHSLPEQQCTFMIAELNTTYIYIFGIIKACRIYYKTQIRQQPSTDKPAARFMKKKHK